MSGWSWRSRSAAAFAAGVSLIVGAVVVAPAGSAAKPAVSGEEWAWPVRGSIVTPYSNDNSRPYAGGMHRGIDISASAGASVAAARAGRVTYAGVLGSSGLTLAIATADGRYSTSYLHLASVAVKRGESVETGQKLGEVGTSGRRSVSQPHLHFGVRRAGRERFYVDPLMLLPPLPGARPESPVPAAPLTAPARVVPGPAPVKAKPVPAGALTRPRARPVALPHPPVGERVPVHEGLAWAPLVSLAGLLLLGAVLARRLLRQGHSIEPGPARSRAIRGESPAQPAARAPAVPARLGSVSQMG